MTTERSFDPVVPAEGWHVLHLFYRVEYGQWSLLGREEQLQAKTNLSLLIQEVRATENTQLLAFSVVTPKADVGFMLLTPDLQTANAFEKRLTLSLGPDVLTPTFSYLSMTERSEYTTSEADYTAETLEKERGLTAGTPEFDAALAEFRERMEKYGKERLYPKLGNRPVLCCYSMSKRRSEKQNWYRMNHAERKDLMLGHARIGRQWAGKIRQLVTGSTGLDDSEWFVTLFAHDTHDVKGIIYEMRFDPVSAEYAEFGEFYIGLQLPLDELFRRLQL